MIKTILHRYPLLRGLIVFMLGIYFHNSFNEYATIAAYTFIVISFIIIAIFLNHPKYKWQPIISFSLLLSLFFAGAIYTNSREIKFIDYSGSCTIDGYISKISKRDNNSTRAEIFADTLTLKGVKHFEIEGLVVFSDSLYYPTPGDVVHLKAYIKPPKKLLYDSFSYSDYLENNGLQFIAYVNDCDVEPERRSNISTAIGYVQSTVDNQLSTCGISNENMPLLKALFLGDKSELSNKIKNDFSCCGTIHILAVSGMHVGIIYLFLCVIAKLIFRGRKIGTLLILGGVWSYAIIAGMSPSIFRAAIMTSSYELARMINQKADVYSTIAIAMMIILIVDPMSIYLAGFWLSFAAVIGIIAFYQPLHLLLPTTNIFTRFVYDSVVVTTSAQIATLPIILYLFHSFPTYFIINNLIIVPLASPIIIGALIVLIISSISIWVATTIGGLVDGFLQFIREYASWASSWPNALITDIPFTSIEMISLAIFVFFLAIGINWGGKNNIRRIIYSLSAFYIISTILNIEASTHSEIIIYENYGKLNISINNYGHITHLLADTSSTIGYTTSSTINRIARAISSTYDILKDGTQIITPFDTITIIATQATYDKNLNSTVEIICDEVLPKEVHKNTYSILSTSVYNINRWKLDKDDTSIAILESGQNPNGIIIEQGQKKCISLHDK